MAALRPLIAEKERFRPPRVRDIAGMIGRDETDIRRLFKLLGRLGKVDEVAHDHFFLRGTVAEMAETAADLAAKAATASLSLSQLSRARSVANAKAIAVGSRAGVLARFASVAQALFATLKPNDDNGEADIAAALAQFETWYAQTHTTPFWTLFEHYIPETPRVDF